MELSAPYSMLLTFCVTVVLALAGVGFAWLAGWLG